ncbi:MAG: hypothetical protein WAW17_09835 [Rhodococcus sp. (in: high G+C Gram-positive bacteria)]
MDFAFLSEAMTAFSDLFSFLDFFTGSADSLGGATEAAAALG